MAAKTPPYVIYLLGYCIFCEVMIQWIYERAREDTNHLSSAKRKNFIFKGITGESICIDGGMTRQMIYHGDHCRTLDNG